MAENENTDFHTIIGAVQDAVTYPILARDAASLQRRSRPRRTSAWTLQRAKMEKKRRTNPVKQRPA